MASITFTGWKISWKVSRPEPLDETLLPAYNGPMTALTTKHLLEAYRCGIFPMAETRDSEELFWVEPKIRGILPLDGFHVPRELKKLIKKERFRVTANKAFLKVMRLCGSPAAGREETWINEDILALYGKLHEQGYAHSIEVWEMGELAGGLYGVAIGGAFCGESMFYLKTGASKVALAYTVARLKAGGFVLFDVQFLTGHLKRFGAIEVSQDEYLAELQKALELTPDFYSLPEAASTGEVLQLIAQTS